MANIHEIRVFNQYLKCECNQIKNPLQGKS